MSTKILETSLSRVYKHLTDDSTCAIISAYRSERSLEENKRLFAELKNEVRKAGFGYVEFISRWSEDGQAFDEESILIPGCSEKQATAWGTAYDQASVIFKDEDSCREICTNDFTDDGKYYVPYNTVRVFNNVGKGMLNVEDAKEIFAKRKMGPVSKLKKGDQREYTLKVVEKVEARPSVFRGPGYVTILEDTWKN